MDHTLMPITHSVRWRDCVQRAAWMLVILMVGSGCASPQAVVYDSASPEENVRRWMYDLDWVERLRMGGKPEILGLYPYGVPRFGINADDWLASGRSIGGVEGVLEDWFAGSVPDRPEPKIPGWLVARAFAEIGGRKNAPGFLLALRRSDDPKVRLVSARTLAKWGVSAAIMPLCETAREDPDSGVRIGAMRALASLGGQKARECLSDLARDSTELGVYARDALDDMED